MSLSVKWSNVEPVREFITCLCLFQSHEMPTITLLASIASDVLYCEWHYKKNNATSFRKANDTHCLH